MPTFQDTDFLWGASTSSYQVEGGNDRSDWWDWEKKGYTPPSGIACDHYNRYKEDFEIAAKLSHNAHRLGIEWSRVQVSPDEWNGEQWSHYRDVMLDLTGRGITPLLTLNHFTVPLWFEKAGGWANDSSPSLFADLAEKACRELGDIVKYWITINEPHMLAFIGHFYGNWPPFEKNRERSFHILKNLIKAHVEAWRRMKSVSRDNADIKSPVIGIAKAVTAFHPSSRLSLADITASNNRRYAHNHSFIDSLLKGRINVPGLDKEELPEADCLDFIGLNYYFRQFIKKARPFREDPLGEVDGSCPRATGNRTDMNWEIYPRGLYEVCLEFKKYGLPVIITENGIATYRDEEREAFIREHIGALAKASAKGLPLKGYLHWSLLDNFEWSEGYTKKFGLVEVDPKDLVRKIRRSGLCLADIIQRNAKGL
jgi:beta-glucosidase